MVVTIDVGFGWNSFRFLVDLLCNLDIWYAENMDVVLLVWPFDLPWFLFTGDVIPEDFDQMPTGTV